MKIALILLISISPLFAAKDPVVATVNGKQILESQLNKTFTQNLLYVQNATVTREKVLNDLINRELGIMRAKKNKLDKNKVVKEKMEDILYHAQISKDLEPQFKKIVVTDKEVKDYYNNFKEYRTAQILFRVRVSAEEAEVKAAQDQAMKIYSALQKKPHLFGELANKYSQSNTAPNGGDMGFQAAVQLAPEYYMAVNGKAINHITPPVRSQYGYHIIKVLAVKDYKNINTTFYKKVVYDQKRDAIMAKYFDELRRNQRINVNKKYIQ